MHLIARKSHWRSLRVEVSPSPRPDPRELGLASHKPLSPLAPCAWGLIGMGKYENDPCRYPCRPVPRNCSGS